MATIPTPATWVPGSKFTAAQANLEVSDSANFMLNPPQANASLGSNISVATGVWQLCTLDVEAFDTDTMHGTSTTTSSSLSNSRLTATTPGLYCVTYSVTWQTATDLVRAVDLRKGAGGVQTNGSRVFIHYVNGVAGLQANLTRSVDVRMATGEYLEMFGFCNSVTTPRNIVAGAEETFLSMRFEAV